MHHIHGGVWWCGGCVVWWVWWCGWVGGMGGVVVWVGVVVLGVGCVRTFQGLHFLRLWTPTILFILIIVAFSNVVICNKKGVKI
jgi:hypothetical protein